MNQSLTDDEELEKPSVEQLFLRLNRRIRKRIILLVALVASTYIAIHMFATYFRAARGELLLTPSSMTFLLIEQCLLVGPALLSGLIVILYVNRAVTLFTRLIGGSPTQTIAGHSPLPTAMMPEIVEAALIFARLLNANARVRARADVQAEQLIVAGQRISQVESRYERILETSAEAILAVNEAQHIIVFNRAAEALFGYTAGEVLGQPLDILLPENMILAHRAFIRDFAADSAQFRGMAGRSARPVGKRKDGALFPIQASISKYDDDGSLIFTVILHDLVEAERYQREINEAAQRITQAETRYARILETSGEAILAVNEAQQIIIFNRTAEVLFGYTATEILGKRLDILLPDNMILAHRMFIKDFASDPVPYRGMSGRHARPVGKRKDGTLFPIEASISKYDEDGALIFTVILHDLLEQERHKREVQAIAEVAEGLRLARTRTEIADAILREVVSALLADAASLQWWDAASKVMVTELAVGEWQSATGKRVPQGEGLTQHIVDSRMPYLNNAIMNDPRVQPDRLGNTPAVVAVPLTVEDQIVGIVWAGRRFSFELADVTLLKAIADIAANALFRADLIQTLEQRVEERTMELTIANERLKQLDRMKSQFVADVSHELRTPVTNLNLNAYLMEHDTSHVNEHFDNLKKQIARLRTLVESILDLSRLELRGSQIQMEAIDLHGVIESVIDAHRERAHVAGLSLEYVPTPGLPLVHGEYNQLAQVVTNLVANALNYTQKGFVRVSTYYNSEDQTACLVVQDSGIGIAPDDIPRIFERFYRGKGVAQSGIPGTGLGLGIVKEIIDLHRGSIDVLSEVDQGSTFRACLPIAA